jgi:GAF domain-containing protein
LPDISPLSGNPYRAILEVSAALVSSLEMDEVFGNVAQKIGEAMNVRSVDIQTYDSGRDTLTYEAFWSIDGVSEEDAAYVGTVTNVRERPDWRRVLERRQLVEQHVDDASLATAELDEMRRWGYRSTLDAPLVLGDEVIGVLGVAETRFVRRFTPMEHGLFRQLCELAAIGIHNARVFRSQQERTRHFASLIAIGRALATSRGSQALLDAVTRSSAEALGAPRAIVYDFDATAGTITPRSIYQRDYDPAYDTVGVPEDAAQGLGDRAILTSDVPIIEQASDPTLAEVVREGLAEWGEKTVINVPFVFHGQLLGVLMLAWTERERQFTENELDLLAGVAHQAGAAFKNARLREALLDPATPAGRAEHLGDDETGAGDDGDARALLDDELEL